MKWVRRGLVILAGLILLLGFSGCGRGPVSLEINTTLQMDRFFNGSRTMRVMIPKNVYKKVFLKDQNSLEAAIAQKLPEAVDCSITENEDGSASIDLTIDFKNAQDYHRKILALSSLNPDPSDIIPYIDFEYEASILKNGYVIEENYSSLDLTGWLDGALKAGYPKLKGKEDTALFVLNQTTLIFDGQEMDMPEGIICASNITSNAFDSVTVSITPVEEGYLAVVRYLVSNKVVAKLGAPLDNLMRNLFGEEAELTYTDAANSRTYMLTFKAADEEDMTGKLNKALKSSDSAFSVNVQGDEDALTASESFICKLNAGFFLDYTDDHSRLVLSLNVKPAYTLTELKSLYGFLGTENITYSGEYCQVDLPLSSTDEITAVFGFAVDVESISVDTVIHSDTQMERTFALKVSSSADYLVGMNISQKMNMLADSYSGNVQEGPKREAVMNDVIYTITVEADSQELLSQITRAFFGETEDETAGEMKVSVLEGVKAVKRGPLKLVFEVEDTLNLSGLLRGSQVKDGIAYSITYPKRYKADFAEAGDYEEGECLDESLSCRTFNRILTVKSKAERANGIGIALIVILVIALIVMLFILVVNMRHIISLLTRHQIDVPEEALFKGPIPVYVTLLCIAAVCFVFTGFRLLLAIY